MRIRSQTRTVRVYDKPRACRAHRDSRAGPNLLALREGEEGTVSHENGPLVAVTLRDSDRYGWVEKASLDIGDVDVEGPLRVVRTTTRPLTRFTWTRRKHLIGVRHVCQPQKLKFDNNGIPYVSVVENPPMRIYLHQNFPDLDLDTVVVLIVTIFTDTSPMRYAPLPLVGGFADWDDLMRLGVKVHWKGSDGTYLMGQVQMETGDEVDPLEMYYSVSNLNAALRGLVYENPSPLRPGYGVAHVNDFTMDWLGQKSTVCDQPIQHVQEPGIVTLVPRLKSLGFKVVNPANSTAARLKSLGSKVLNPTKSVVQTSVCDTCEASVSDFEMLFQRKQ